MIDSPVAKNSELAFLWSGYSATAYTKQKESVISTVHTLLFHASTEIIEATVLFCQEQLSRLVAKKIPSFHCIGGRELRLCS